MLDSKIQFLKDHFGITNPADWQSVEPAWILSMDGIGQATLDYLRLLLAAQSLTLKNDRTPEHWEKHLGRVKISHTLGNEFISDDVDRGRLSPFVVLVDSAEQQPFTFQGLRSDASDGNRPIIVPTERRSIGRYPVSLGDYSLEGAGISGLGRCHIERKSMQDAHGTFLGWGRNGDNASRRERFEQELENLSQMEAGLVLVECSFSDLLRLAPATKKTAAENAKTLHRSVLSWQQDYDCRWIFADGRRLAEQTAYRWLERWFRKRLEERKAEEKRLKQKSAAAVAGKLSDQPITIEANDDIAAMLATL